MSGRVAIITGANSGIGFKVAEYMCEAGDNVFLACRSEEKGKAAVDKIKKKNPQALAHFLQLDLNSQESIKKFVEEFRATGKKLSVLICNAGLAMLFKGKTRTITEEKFEMTMATNHLGHFLLVDLLLEDLKKTGSDTGNARVIVVASSQHDVTKIPKQSGIFLTHKELDTSLANGSDYPSLVHSFTADLIKPLDFSGKDRPEDDDPITIADTSKYSKKDARLLKMSSGP